MINDVFSEKNSKKNDVTDTYGLPKISKDLRKTIERAQTQYS